jgi:hypothetical protein
MWNQKQQDTEIERIKSRLVALCDEALASEDSYLLSRLGVDLGKDAKTLSLLSGHRLAEFIRTQLSDRYQVVSVVGLPHIFAVVRTNKQTPGAQAAPIPPPSKTELRYNYRFWAAFSVPPKGVARYLDPENLIFKDLAAGESPPLNWINIDIQFIAPATAPNRDQLIKASIESWLSKYSQDKSRFLHGSEQKVFDGKSLLALMLDELDSGQLKTTSLTMDVIKALSNKIVK